jgi:hypothetical protein
MTLDSTAKVEGTAMKATYVDNADILEITNSKFKIRGGSYP